MGYALSEESLSKKGQVLKPVLVNCGLPTSVDTPDVETLIVEVEADQGLAGPKGWEKPPL